MDQRAAKKFRIAPTTIPTSLAGNTPINGESSTSARLDEPSEMAAPESANRRKDFSLLRFRALSNVQRELTAKEKLTATAQASTFARRAARPIQVKTAKTRKSIPEFAMPTTAKRIAFVDRRDGGAEPFMGEPRSVSVRKRRSGG